MLECTIELGSPLLPPGMAITVHGVPLSAAYLSGMVALEKAAQISADYADMDGATETEAE